MLEELEEPIYDHVTVTLDPHFMGAGDVTLIAPRRVNVDDSPKTVLSAASATMIW